MKVLDVGCGVGGPAREMVKFTSCHVTGLNINQYQVQRATHYAAKEGLSHKLDFVQGDFMVRSSLDRDGSGGFIIHLLSGSVMLMKELRV